MELIGKGDERWNPDPTRPYSIHSLSSPDFCPACPTVTPTHLLYLSQENPLMSSLSGTGPRTWGEDQTHQMIAMDRGEGSRNGHALPCFGGVRVSQLGLSNSAQARQAQAQVGVSSRRTGLSANLLGARNREQDALKLPLRCAEAGVNEAASPAYP